MKICEWCQKEVDITKLGPYASGRFCSRRCACVWVSNQNREEKNRKISKALKPEQEKESARLKKLEKTLTGLSTAHNANRWNRDQKIVAWLCGEWSGTKSGGRISETIRNYLLEKYDNSCQMCGFRKMNPTSGKWIVEIHHIDGDSDNNSRENLQALCPNCHAATPTYRKLNKGNGKRIR